MVEFVEFVEFVVVHLVVQGVCVLVAIGCCCCWWVNLRISLGSSH